MNTRKLLPAVFGIALLLVGCATAQDSTTDATPDYDVLFGSGATYEEFLEAATSRKGMWTANTDSAAKLLDRSADLVRRVEDTAGEYRMLVVAVDGCSDSANTIPYLAHLAANARNLELRIVHPDDARHIMEGNRTPDGRAATPTVLLLNKAGGSVGAFVERPSALQDWAIANKSSMRSRDFMREKFAWYDADGGRSTLAEMVALIETAASVRQ